MDRPATTSAARSAAPRSRVRGSSGVRMTRLPLPFGVDVVELHAVAELVTLQVQQLRGAALVPLGSIRRTQYQGSLELFDQRLERDAGRRDDARERVVDALAERGFLGRARPRCQLQML